MDRDMIIYSVESECLSPVSESITIYQTVNTFTSICKVKYLPSVTCPTSVFTSPSSLVKSLTLPLMSSAMKYSF